MGKDSLVKRTLYAAVDFIVNESAVDICMLCMYYNESSQSEELEKDDQADCCVWRRKRGNIACREGLIEHFQVKAMEDNNESDIL